MNDSPLHAAETAAEVARLCAAGVGTWVDRPGWMGATPLHSAAQRGRAEVAEALLARGANVDARRPERLDTPLHFAAGQDVARVLLAAGAEVDALDWSGRAPLHWAGQFGHGDVAAELIAAGAEVDRPAADGMTPLHWAAQEGHAPVVARLLAAGAEVNRPDRGGWTPLHRAVWRNRVEVAVDLLAAGADPTLRGADGSTARHLAIERELAEVVRLIDAAGPASARGDRPMLDPPPGGANSFLKVRAHPTRPEVVTTAAGAHLHRWAVAGASATVAAGLQAADAALPAVAVDPAGATVAVATSSMAIEFRRWDDLQVVASIPLTGFGPPRALDLSPDGRWLAVAADHEQVALIERSTGQVVAETEGGEDTLSIRFDPTGRLLAVACSFQGGAYVRIERVTAAGLELVVELDRNEPRRARRTWADRLIALGSLVRGVGRPADGGYVDVLVDLKFSPDGRSLALFETARHGLAGRSAGWRGNLVLFDVATGAVRWLAKVDARATDDPRSLTAAGHGMGFATEVVFLDDATLACGATRGGVLFYAVGDGTLIRRARVHPEAPVVALALVPAGGGLWAALGDGAGPLVPVPT